MKVRSNIKAGGVKINHNEKTMSDNNSSIERGKCSFKKLNLKKETIRELRETELKRIAGGAADASVYSCLRTNCCPQ